MARENHPDQAAEQSTPYPSYDCPQIQFPDAQSPQNLAPPYQPEPASSGRPRSRRPSHSTQDIYQSGPLQPVQDAVANVFDAPSGAAAQVPPEQLKQLREDITADVTADLLNKLAARWPLPLVAQPPPSPLQTNSIPAAPHTVAPQSQSHNPQPPSPIDVAKPAPSYPLHSPTSPNRDATYGSSLSDYQFPNENLHGSVNGAREDLSGRYGDRTEDLPLRRTDTQSRRNTRDVATGEEPPAMRPPTIKRVHTDEDETIVEKMWQPLFVNEKPTPRLGQFLRGLALHLVSDLPFPSYPTNPAS